jgi:hypothetical protein
MERKILISLLLISAFISGCACYDSKGKVAYYMGIGFAPLESSNRRKLSKLSTGMTKQEVLRIMGTETYSCYSSSHSNPDELEILQVDNRTFEILYYLTDSFSHASVNGVCIRLDNSWFPRKDYNLRPSDSKGYVKEWHRTPLVFEHGKLIGWSREFLRNTSQEYNQRFKRSSWGQDK